MKRFRPEFGRNTARLNKYYAFELITFQVDGNSRDAFEVLNNKGIVALTDYLKNWDNGERTEVWDMTKRWIYPWGTSDLIYFKGDYIATVNRGCDYVALYRGIREKEFKELREKGGLI
jgi:hypothetical protein